MSNSLQYVTVDVFTSTRFAGNPLAIVHLPSSTRLSQAQKQIIAREFNYSETVFLHEQHDAENSSTATHDGQQQQQLPTWTVDIFLVDQEVPFAGHPVIGTAVYALSKLGGTGNDDGVLKGRFNVKAGTILLAYDTKTQEAKASIPHEIRVHSAGYDVEGLYSLQPDLQRYLTSKGRTLKVSEEIDVVSIVKGMTFIYVRLPDLEALGAVQLHAGKAAVKRDEGWDFGFVGTMFYVFTGADETDGDGHGITSLRTRMIEGAFEDPATGSASCGLGVLLAMKDGVKSGKKRFAMTQAVEMGRKSDIGVEVVMKGDGSVETVELSGTAIEVMEGRVRYE